MPKRSSRCNSTEGLEMPSFDLQAAAAAVGSGTIDPALPFRHRVLETVRRIPAGTTMSYGTVAEAAGNPGAARAVGTIMKQNIDPSVPCHRVIRADGSIGPYNRGGEQKKRELLRSEGVQVV